MVFGNALDVVRLDGRVSGGLDDAYVMDFLVFGSSQEGGRTVYEGVRRLAPGHVLRGEAGRVAEERYWELAVEEPVYFRREEEYCERFRELVERAVRDRIRTRGIGVFLSGGLDSPTMAAEAARVMGAAGVKGYCVVVDRLIPDEERYYSGLVAKRLGIRVDYRALDGEIAGAAWGDETPRVAEPVENLLRLGHDAAEIRRISRENRVVFHGEGPDNGLEYEWKTYVKWLWGRGKWGRMVRQTASHVRLNGNLPLWRTAAAAVRGGRRREGPEWQRDPGWMNEGTAKRVGLAERWERFWEWRDGRHPVRPAAYYAFTSGVFGAAFGEWESLNEFAPLEFRHPLADVRLVEFYLRVPVIPWARRKLLVRRAMAGVLPEECLKRDKAPMQGDPYFEAMRGVAFPAVRMAGEMGRYVDVKRVPVGPPGDEVEMRMAQRVFGLDRWLEQRVGCRTCV